MKQLWLFILEISIAIHILVSCIILIISSLYPDKNKRVLIIRKFHNDKSGMLYRRTISFFSIDEHFNLKHNFNTFLILSNNMNFYLLRTCDNFKILCEAKYYRLHLYLFFCVLERNYFFYFFFSKIVPIFGKNYHKNVKMCHKQDFGKINFKSLKNKVIHLKISSNNNICI